jgi:hypothetical protein
MKKYKHIPTGRIYEKYDNKSHPEGVYKCSGLSGCFLVEAKIVESGKDWEEIKPTYMNISEVIDTYLKTKQIKVPPGIVKFQYSNRYKNDGHQPLYETWVRGWLKSDGDWATIQTVKDDEEVEFSIGDRVVYKNGLSGGREIWKFEYKQGDWNIFYRGGGYDYLHNLTKEPQRKPVATLQGKDLYVGDTYWFVDKFSWATHSNTISISYKERWSPSDGYIYFATKELAEQYVKDNKPVYPAGLIEPLLDISNPIFHIYPIIAELREFKRNGYKK